MAASHGYSPISSESRVRILAMLIERPDRTVDELTEATGLHPNTVREHLQRLMETGFVLPATEHRTTRGRPRTLYRAAVGPESDIIRDKAEAAAARGDMMRRVMPDTESDLATDEQHQLDAVIEHLEETGFDPVVDEDSLTVDLSPCAHAANGGRCSVHLSLIQSVLTAAGGPIGVGGMNNTCNPQDCVIQLTRRPE